MINNLLRLINGAIGAAMIIAGLALAEIPEIELAQAPGTDAFRLVQFHFLLTGTFSLWASSTTKRTARLASFSLLMLGLNAWLAFLALTSALYWPAVFSVVSAFNFFYLLKTDQPAVDPAASDEQPDDGLVPPEFGAVGAAGPFRGAFRNIAALLISLVALFAILVFGAVYATLLVDAIFKSREVSFEQIFENLTGGAATDALIKMAIIGLVSLFVYGSVYLIEAVIASSSRRKALERVADLDRQLSEHERVFLRDSLKSLLVYLERKSFAPKWGRLHGIGVALVIGAFVGVPAAIVAVEWQIGGALLEGRSETLDPLHYSGPFQVGGAVGGFFAGCGAFWSLYQWLGTRTPEFGEYLFARAGWNSMNNRPREPNELLWVLTRHVRTRAIDIDSPFEPSAVLRSAFREHESVVYKSTAVAIVLTCILGAADIARFELVDDRAVTYSRYFQFRTQTVALAEVDRVELRCHLFRADDDGNANLGLDYILVKEGEFRIDILDNEEDADRLARLEAIDGTLANAGVPFTMAPTAGFLQGDRSSFISDCAAEIADRYEAEIALRLGALLRAARFAGTRP